MRCFKYVKNNLIKFLFSYIIYLIHHFHHYKNVSNVLNWSLTTKIYAKNISNSGSSDDYKIKILSKKKYNLFYCLNNKKRRKQS